MSLGIAGVEGSSEVQHIGRYLASEGHPSSLTVAFHLFRQQRYKVDVHMLFRPV